MSIYGDPAHTTGPCSGRNCRLWDHCPRAVCRAGRDSAACEGYRYRLWLEDQDCSTFVNIGRGAI